MLIAIILAPSVIALDITSCYYKVVKVQENDVLTVRFGPATKYEKVGIIPYNGIKIRIMGDEIKINKSKWVPIQHKIIAGWVNLGFLKKDCETTRQNSPVFHVIKLGDTIFSLSRRYGYNIAEIANWNNLQPPYSIKEGQSLRVSPLVILNQSCLYQVINVDDDDMLWIRADVDPYAKRLGGIPHDATDVQIIGEIQKKDDMSWVPVKYKGITGWINQVFIKENCE
ncbi:MAG: LysM peptidoglycan-binding domain-containing protein [Bacteroidales bacterium]|nr:LysM peptidoglycan-binding domain-containing protein [Bacteroidales bacterium]